MKTKTYLLETILHFSRWNGKGYAIFIALGRQVKIAGLALHICLCALLKSARKGLIVNLASVWETCVRRKVVEQMREMLVVCFRQGEVCPVRKYVII